MAKARLFSKKPLFPDQVPTSCNSFINPVRHVGKEWSQRLQRNDKPGGPVADLHKVLPPSTFTLLRRPVAIALLQVQQEI